VPFHVPSHRHLPYLDDYHLRGDQHNQRRTFELRHKKRLFYDDEDEDETSYLSTEGRKGKGKNATMVNVSPSYG